MLKVQLHTHPQQLKCARCCSVHTHLRQWMHMLALNLNQRDCMCALHFRLHRQMDSGNLKFRCGKCILQ